MTDLTPWWRQTPLSESEERLFRELILAHYKSAFRPSSSTTALIHAATGSGNIGNAIAAAILTLGGKHAPLEETIFLLSRPEPALRAKMLLAEKQKVPGWGGTFQKQSIDQIWMPVAVALEAVNVQLYDTLNEITRVLHLEGKPIYPNPSAFTAATCISLGCPPKAAVHIFIEARLNAWAEIALNSIENQP